ncbi:hydroxyacylglutathione hydrolase [Pseudovibrio sp. SPO723]|uniref:hydroxyacylglutathione hydrolase n=1 Tax=Nesiotobacter zosterae TaxID=392721 RepID=UPI0029C256A0|nr:hydroxyacylglutathione hydrolase [Pseudovibrio sp. SPO723]MDX5594967.1 hydroxyacylglutathione hydrolase [Pseudovibrio sp. SPO723]
MSQVEYRQFTCLSDNFGVIVHDPQSGTTIALDVPDAAPYLAVLEAEGWNLTDILITHHHWDHVGGLGELKEKSGARVVGPARTQQKLSEIEVGVEDGDHIMAGPLKVRALATPGHTLDHITWWFEDAGLAHTGDTLFALGCGRLFEGDAQMMWASLTHIVDTLPEETVLFCGHEYTLSNARFALTIDPENTELIKRVAEIEALRREDKATLPTTLKLELATNPFLRAANPAIQKHLGMEGAPLSDVFAEIRQRKDMA